MKLFSPFLLMGILCLAMAQTAFPQYNANNRIVFAANMTGEQEVPPVVTNARGLATYNISPDLTTVTIHGVFSGLSGTVTGCQIREGKAGVNGSLFLDLTDSISGNELRAVIEPPFGFIQKGLEYKLYLNVQTTANPDGEIRGQLEVESAYHFFGYLDGVQAVPFVSTQASGLASITYQPSNFWADYKIILNDVSEPITGIDLMEAQIGATGPVILSLNNSNPSIGQIDMSAVPSDFISKLESNNIAVNVRTAAHPDGEIKGQFVRFKPVSFEGFLNGDQVDPPVVTSAQGLVVAKMTSDLDSLHYFASVTGLTPNNATINIAPPGASGANIGFVDPSVLPNLYFGSFTITPQQAVKILNGNGYIIFSTVGHPNGEIRAQLQPTLRQCFAFDLCGNQEVPPSGSGAIGTAIISADLLNTHLTYRYIADGLSGPATGAQLEEAPFGANGTLLAPINPPSPFGSGQFQVDGNFMVKLQSDNTCLNILTGNSPNGEIRGQVRKELSCEEITGVDEQVVSGWRVFPNPATESLTIEFFAETSFEAEIQLCDLTGRLVRKRRENFAQGEQSLQIDLGDLPPGLYFAKLNGQGMVMTAKFGVMK